MICFDWIPTFAGMTGRGAGMTGAFRNGGGHLGMTARGVREWRWRSQSITMICFGWIPAFAGMTVGI